MSGQGEASHPATISTVAKILIATMCALFGTAAQAQIVCTAANTVTANVVAMDQPILFNRLGASNINGMIYALARDVVDIATEIPVDPNNTLTGLQGTVMLRPDKRPRPLVLRIAAGDCLTVNFTNLLAPAPNPKHLAALAPPITVFIDEQVAERNASFHVSGLQWVNGPQDDGSFVGDNVNSTVIPGGSKTYTLYAPVEGTFIVRDMASTVGSDANQGNSSNLLFGQVIVEPRGARIYRSQTTEEELRLASMVSADPTAANCGARNLTPFGQPIIDYEALYPTFNCTNTQSVILAGVDGIANTIAINDTQVMAVGAVGLAATDIAVSAGADGILSTVPLLGSDDLIVGTDIVVGANLTADTASAGDDTQAILPGTILSSTIVVSAGANGILDTPVATGDELLLPGADLGATTWGLEDKAGLPILNMLTAGNEIVHSEINGLIVGPGDDGTWFAACNDTNDNGYFDGGGGLDPFGGACPYPLESIGKRNPSLPNRLEAFRDFASVFHDEPATAQAFPGFYKDDPVFRYVLAGVKDGFMINYGSGGIGSEIIANRLGVGPMHDCLTCAYEEFFLTSYTVGDPAQLTDIAANMGLELLQPDLAGLDLGAVGPKASYVPYPEDPANVHHSYTGDFVKFRNVHVGNEQHVFHLHNHQWLYNPNDDNANYLDAQGIGPGVGYTYEINYGGSGNRMKSSGDAIFHCHFYPHFAQGMWAMWRNHDVLETGTPLQASAVAVGLNGVGQLGFHGARWALENGSPMIVGTTTVPKVTDPVAVRARALPDGEIVAGAPIPAIVPLPGKAMAPVPGEVRVIPNQLTTTASTFLPGRPANGIVPVGSLAEVVQRDVHPGYPFWIAGIEDIVGQRPPTPPLDMVTSGLATDLSDSTPRCADGELPYFDGSNSVCADESTPQNGLVNKIIKRADGTAVSVSNLFEHLNPAQADGWDGGLPRTALQGMAAGGSAAVTISELDFSKVLIEAQAVFFPEEGTDIEQIAMAYHSIRNHPSYKLTIPATGTEATAASFVLNGNKPAVGAPYHEPCIDDQGYRFAKNNDPTSTLNFWAGSPGTFINAKDEAVFDADTPRIYKGVNIQFDVVLNKAGYHYPQQRIISLWEDAVPVITKAKAPEPMVMRFNSFECGVYHHANLVPEYYELDDYQVRTPTDIIGQHIHLPKWDLTTADGSANGWNYEDGTLSPGSVQERIHALNAFVTNPVCADESTPDAVTGLCLSGLVPDQVANGNTHATAAGSTIAVPADFAAGTAHALPHPYFSTQMPPGGLADKWMGARTTTQRWFFDPVLNTDNEDRGLGLIFTHDHYGPSTHQQVGLYATILTQPSKSTWKHNETGEQLGCRSPAEQPELFGTGGACRKDGGPTSWQAIIEPDPLGSQFNPGGQIVPHREFYFEYTDFQHAYEAGVYVGANQDGEAFAATGPGLPMVVEDLGNPADCDDPANAFRCAINPPGRLQHQTLATSPDLVEEIAFTPAVIPDPNNPGGTIPNPNNFCPTRPCPQAIDVQDPGMFAVNYRNEPVALRVFDPNKLGPDGLPGTQADGAAGDLAFALASVDENSNTIVRQYEVQDWNGTLPPGSTTGHYKVMNIQPKAGNSIYGTIFAPPINNFGSLKGGDPYTPMVRTMAGDLTRIKMQSGGDEEEHVATVHGIKWLQGGSAFGGAPNSGWRNAQPAGISEQFTLKSPVIGVVGERGNSTDYVYSMDASQDGYWSGLWGLMRVYGSRQNSLALLSGSPFESTNSVNIKSDGFDGVCPAITTGKGKNKVKGPDPDKLRQYNVTAVLANDILGAPAGALGGGLLPADPHPTMHVGGSPDQDGGTLVYNSRAGGANGSLLHDPTAILYVRTEDMMDIDNPKAGLKPGVPVEPLILRANAGDCIDVTLRNRLLTQAASGGAPVIDANGAAVFLDSGAPLFVADSAGLLACGSVLCTAVTATVAFDQMPELATYSTLIGAVKRNRGVAPAPGATVNPGSTTFQTNLIQASPWVGMHPQLVEFDSSRHNGIHSGKKAARNTLAGPGDQVSYRWYAGHLDVSVAASRKKTEFVLTATPVELGASNLQPADVIKQGMKSMVGQLVIEPEGSTWAEESSMGGTNLAELDFRAGTDPNIVDKDPAVADPPRKTRAMVTVTDGDTQFRDLSMVWAKGLTQYYNSLEPVEHINGEGDGIPEDPQDGTGMAINYGVEPLWHRLGILPNAPFGNDMTPNSFGAQDQDNLFSNGQLATPADPQTPVFTATAGDETRMRIGMPHGTNRGSTFTLHGHLWQRDPYITQNHDVYGFPNSVVDGGPGIGSMTIGNNPLGFYMGALESIWPSTHYDIRLPKAGGENSRRGDYLYRDFGAVGNASGLWGILRVE